VDRDQKHVTALQAIGWETLVVWECEAKDLNVLKQRLIEFLSPN